MSLLLFLEWFFCVTSWVMLLSKKRFCKRNGGRDWDVFMGNNMMKFQNKKVREGWIVVVCVCFCVLLGPLYIEPSM